MAKIKGDVIDFEGVEAGGGGGGAKVPEDDYRVKVAKIERKESKSSGNDMLVWHFEITKGKYKGKKLKPVYTVLQVDSLWKLMSVVGALGFDTEKISIKETMKKALEKECGVTVVDGEEYNNKIPSEIADHFPLEELNKSDDDSDDDSEDEEPKAKKKGKKDKKGKKKKADDDEDIEDLDLDSI